MATTDYSEILAKLGLTTEEAIKAWQKEYGLEQTGVWGETEQAAYDTFGALPFKNAQALRDYQLSRGIKETGEWDNATKLAYRQDMAAKGAYSDVNELAALILQQYNTPTTNMDEITASVEAYMRNAYDQSVADRKKQTEEQRAMIDLDAYSRGLGSSTWVTDAKQRLADAEADDIARMEANYQAGLSEAVLNQYNTAVAQGLAAQDNAYALAAQLYNLGQNAKSSVGSGSLGGSGGGGGGYAYTTKKSGGGNGGGDDDEPETKTIYDSSTPVVKGSNTIDITKKHSNKDNQAAYYDSYGYTPFYAQTTTNKSSTSANKNKTGNGGR